MNTKVMIASTMLAAILTAPAANAGDNDFLAKAIDTSTSQPFVIKHAYLLTTPVATDETEEVSGSR